MTSGSRLFYRMFWDFTWTIFRNKHKAHRASTTLRQGSVVTLDLRTTSRNIIKLIPSDPTSLACTKHKICPSQKVICFENCDANQASQLVRPYVEP